ncbi:MAG: RICIN domain-containing protein [Chitinophagaceae bacterium]
MNSNHHAAGKRLDVAGAVDANGTNVLIYQSSNNSAQRWKVVDVGS